MMTLAEVRPAIVAALETGPWHALDDMPDALQPPVLVVAWSNPWLEVQTPCNYRAAATVICVANRLTPGTGLELLEAQVGFVIDALQSALRLPVMAVPGPQALDVAGITYLTARVPVIVPIHVTATALERA